MWTAPNRLLQDYYSAQSIYVSTMEWNCAMRSIQHARSCNHGIQLILRQILQLIRVCRRLLILPQIQQPTQLLITPLKSQHGSDCRTHSTSHCADRCSNIAADSVPTLVPSALPTRCPSLNPTLLSIVDDHSHITSEEPRTDPTQSANQ